MFIYLPQYTKNYDLIPFSTDEEAVKYGLQFDFKGMPRDTINDYIIYWGSKPLEYQYGAKYGIMETGFFNNASFIDTVGNYQNLSLNTRDGNKAVLDFELGDRKSARELILNQPLHLQSKYNASYKEPDSLTKWEGVVLALQNPGDRAIMSVTSREIYLKFVEDCCKFYGKNLFVKFHPWNSNEKYTEMENIVKKYGCQYGKTVITVINKCQFVIAYNSTFAVDCLLRDVPYVQYGMGTFFNSHGIIYSKNTFPTEVKKIPDAGKLCDFLIYRYCFNKNMEKEKFANMIKHYSRSNEMFPMTDEYCYAYNTKL